MSTSAPFVPDSSIHIRDMVKYPRTSDRLRAWRAYPYREGRTLPDMWFGCECPATPRPKDDKRPADPRHLFHYGAGIGGDTDSLRPFRFVGFADEVDGGPDHTGWYADEYRDGSTMMRGAVFQIPARDGSPLFLAGYEWGEGTGKRFTSGGGCIEYGGRGDTYESKEEAARAADSLAEYAAEVEREYQETESARIREEEEEAEEEAAREDATARALRLAGEVVNATGEPGALPADSPLRPLIDALEEALEECTPAPTSADSE